MYLSLITNIIQLRFTSENQAAISSTIQNFGRLIDLSREQQSQNSTNQVVQLQQARYPSPGHPHSAAHYVPTAPYSMYTQRQPQNDHCKSLL